LTDYDKKICFICGEAGANSVDHISPKSIFLKKYRNIGKDLITVPTHISCNKCYEKDDEYFRLFLSIPGFWESKPARELWNMKIIKQISHEKSKKYKQYILNSIHPIELSTPQGIYLGSGDVVHIDANRIKREVERITRGIFYHETKMILPLDSKINVNFMQPTVRSDRRSLEKKGKFKTFAKGIFKYFWTHTKDSQNGFFWFTFFDCVDFWVFTGELK